MIPRSFTLGGVTWNVSQLPLCGTLGQCHMPNATIQLEKALQKEVKEQTFCHELVHAIMFTMGMRDHDERFVDGFAVFLHQYLKQQGKL